MAMAGNENQASAAEDSVINIENIQIVSIPRVPQRLRLREDDAYDPRIISFGPYHRGQPRLQDMEKHKQRYLQAFLSRNESPYGVLENKIKELEADVRSRYSDNIDIGLEENEEFVKMMMLDGCFIVEYLIRFHENILVLDEVSNMIWVRPLLHHDLLLLENQIPFFLLRHIFNHVKLHQQALSQLTFMDLCINFFNSMFRKNISLQPPEPAHLLHLYHSFRVNSTVVLNTNADDDKPAGALGAVPAKKEKVRTKNVAHTRRAPVQSEEDEPIMIPSATVLQEYGITFKKNAKESSILDIKFSKGVLEIPHLVIDAFTKSEFRNLIAFEQFYPGSKGRFQSNFSAYIEFMDYIVNSPEDVALLYQKGILKHFLGNDNEVADLFNNLNRGTFIDPRHYLSELYKEVNKYHNFFWPRWRTNLMVNYFNTPWAGLSVAAAAILLILTIVQTVFSVYSAF